MHVIPGFLGPREIEPLRRICEEVHRQVLVESPAQADAANIAYLTESRYFSSREADLLYLLEFIADPRIVSLLREVSGEEPLFHNTQYFRNPATCSWPGEWHRDTQFLAPDPALEARRMKQHTGVHFRVAFLPDAQLEYVPGSHLRWDTPQELAIRKGADPTRPDMPGRTRIVLQAQDACLFHAWGIHRGNYHAKVPRQTLDIIYGWGSGCDYAPPPPMCFEDLALLERLGPGAREFFGYFIRSYAPCWERPYDSIPRRS